MLVRSSLRAVLLTALGMAVAAPAQESDDPALLRREIRTLEVFYQLGLTRGQAEAMLPHLGELQAAQRELTAARRRRYVDSYAALLRLEQAALAGDPLDPELLATVTRHGERLQRAEEANARRVESILAAIDAILTDQQRGWIEPAAVYESRVGRERAERAARQTAIEAAVAELGGWARTAPAADFAAGRDERVTAILAKAYPDGTEEQLAPLRARLAAYYDQVRAMTPQAFSALRRQLSDRLRELLPLPPAERRYAAARPDWIAILQDPRSSSLLTRLLPALPTGAR